MTDKGKKSKKDGETSLIPVIEKEERQFRDEVKQARDDAKALITDAKAEMQKRIGQIQNDLPILMEQKRNHKVGEVHNQAEQLSHSFKSQREQLLGQIEVNMPKAVQYLVDAVTATGDRA